MRFFVILILVVFAAVGIVVGALNADLVDYDLAFAHLRVPKGAALLAVLLLGWLLGGLTAWLGTRFDRHRDARRPPAAKKPPATP